MDINLLHLQLCDNYMCIIFCEIVLCLLKSEEHEIEKKRMCFEKCFLELKKNVRNNFYEK